ncbi:hypothetical protein [Sulfitobacter sp. 1A12157]|uniref:hypothetical protein n=1 Tax=Sulfitobacter sp. 1A12157 TaxID=3368594 RepID=UPI003744D62A
MILIAALPLLAACAEQIAAKATESCEGYGFTPGSEQFAVCVMKETQSRKAALAAAIADSGDSFNQSMNANRSMSCTSHVPAYGSYVRTTCY